MFHVKRLQEPDGKADVEPGVRLEEDGVMGRAEISAWSPGLGAWS
jgi:hypothetical protein